MMYEWWMLKCTNNGQIPECDKPSALAAHIPATLISTWNDQELPY